MDISGAFGYIHPYGIACRVNFNYCSGFQGYIDINGRHCVVILLFLTYFFNIFHHGPSRSGSPRTIPVLGACLWILYLNVIPQNAEVMFTPLYCP